MVNPIRIKLRLQSETLSHPGLRQFIGKDVVIEVTEQDAAAKPFDFDAAFDTWPDAADDGFEEALRGWRSSDEPRDLPA
jgi:hypothetical protein